jgi:hypothetical protein
MSNLSLKTTGDFRAIGLRPQCGDVEGPDFIGVSGKTARTREFKTITMAEMTTIRATPGSVVRVDCEQPDSRFLSFVSDEGFELIERPASDHAPEATAFIGTALHDALQVLHRQGGRALLCESDNLLRDGVVHVFLETLLSAGQPFQEASSPAATPQPDARMRLCLVTGKMVGTDTMPKGTVCLCANCSYQRAPEAPKAPQTPEQCDYWMHDGAIRCNEPATGKRKTVGGENYCAKHLKRLAEDLGTPSAQTRQPEPPSDGCIVCGEDREGLLVSCNTCEKCLCVHCAYRTPDFYFCISCAPERSHELSASCWCNPRLDYEDPVSGRKLWIHNKPEEMEHN